MAITRAELLETASHVEGVLSDLVVDLCDLTERIRKIQAKTLGLVVGLQEEDDG